MSDSYDLIVVGTSFAAAFFLDEALKHLPANGRVLVLERGKRISHAERLKNRRRLPAERRQVEPASDSLYVNRSAIDKSWWVGTTFGGLSNHWAACTPRMLPEDFELKSRYGVGADWPVNYNELEEYYCRAENIMGVSGPSEDTPFPRSRPYPQPPHRFSEPDRLLKAAFPDRFFQQPCARPTRTLPSGRPACCAAGVCQLCPIDSKFTVQNEMGGVFEDPRVELILGARALTVETAADRARGVRYSKSGGAPQSARSDLVALGAGAMFNPYLLLRSGLDGPAVGKGLVEQAGVGVEVDLDGVDNYQGSTLITGHGYQFYAGAHRAERAAAMIEVMSAPNLRSERGRWRQRLNMDFIFEDLREDRNFVTIGTADESKPEAVFADRSDYTHRGVKALPEMVEKLLAPLPVQRYRIGSSIYRTEAHIIGTTAMGRDPKTSVVDSRLLHHRVRNLVVLGSGVFPTSPPANPTLTLSALSIRAAERLLSSGSNAA